MITTPKTPKSLAFDGINYSITKKPLGSGSQGEVFLAKRTDNPGQKAIVKSIPGDPSTLSRTKYLISSGLGCIMPFTSFPLALTQDNRSGQWFYLATFADGVDLENAPVRPLPERLMTAYLAVSLWCRLEASNIIHGDISLNNLFIGPDGTPQIIDVDNFATLDTSVPGPVHYGQHPIMAPELRDAEARNTPPPIGLMTDRYAWSVALSYLLLQRHPASWATGGPRAFDQAMSSGHWPELARSKTPDLPIRLLSSELHALFENGFSLSPLQRPDAQNWQQVLANALKAMVVHDCGTAFVHETGRQNCPKCQRRIPVFVAHPQQQQQSTIPTITFEHIPSGQSDTFSLPEGQFILVGRDNLPNASGYVSAKHLQIYRQGHMLYVTHVGRNPTVIEFANQRTQHRLWELKEPILNGRLTNCILMLANAQYRTTVAP